MQTLQQLFKTLAVRKRPEDVAQMVMETLSGSLTSAEVRLLEKAARHSLARQVFAYTSMLQEFRKPVGMERQIAKAAELFTSAYHLSEEDCSNPTVVETFLKHLNAEIHKSFGESDFKVNRLDRKARENIGLDLSRRRYNKLFRHLMRMEEKLKRLLAEIQKYEFTLIGKSALATKLTFDEFASHTDTACFIAYLTARANLRSELTIAGQQHAFDEIAAMLLARCQRDSDTNWWAIAHIYPDRTVLDHLSEEQKGMLLGRWFSLLEKIAALLKETWEHSNVNLQTMVVQRGNDSSTWNSTANAWNKARDHWIALLYSLNMESILDVVCPGKVLRLMAGDVAVWHRLTGGGLDPNTLVWREMPLPWDVITGSAICTRQIVEGTCTRNGLDATKTGWVGPRSRKTVAPFRPTPELVHGVTISSPYLATFLRRHGVFSGKGVTPEIDSDLPG